MSQDASSRLQPGALGRREASPAVLIQPPVLDAYAPLLGVAALTAALKQAGIRALPIDLNLELHEALATAEGIEHLRRDHAAELARLHELAAARLLRPALVRAAMGRSLLARPGLAGEIAAAQAALRDPALYRFGKRGTLGISSRTGAHQAVPLLLAIPPAPFSAARALRLLSGEEPLPYRSWLEQVAVPRVLDLDPAWVGLSVTFEQQLLPALVLAGLLRRRGVRVVAGGFHLSAVGCAGLAQDSQLFELLDGVVVGEGEIAIVALDRALRRGGSLGGVPGLVHRDESGGMAGQAPAPRPALAELACPDLAALPLERYLSPVVILPYQVSRGCYFGKCTFCNFTAVSPGYRRRPLARVIEDLGALAEHGRCINFTMEAELPKVCGELSDSIIDAGLDLTWEVMCRLDRALSRDVIGSMARAGCTTIFFGLESASSRMNALMHKSVSGEVARRIIDDCADAGINVVLSGIQGFPGETALERAQTAGFYAWVQERVGDRILVSGGMHTFRLTRSSPIWDESQAFGIAPPDLAGVGPLAVSAPLRRGERSAGAAARGRARDPLFSRADLRAFQESRSSSRRPSTAVPRRDYRPFNHDLLRLALEGCNAGGFRRLAIAHRLDGPPLPPPRPERYRLDPGAWIETLHWDPGSAAPAELLHCVHAAYSVEGVVVPAWLGEVLESTRGAAGVGLEQLLERIDAARPPASPPAGAWLERYVPMLWSAGILEAAGPAGR